MKNRVREVTERTVAFNVHELDFLERLARHAINELPANNIAQATRRLMDRVVGKLEAAQRYRIRRK